MCDETRNGVQCVVAKSPHPQHMGRNGSQVETWANEDYVEPVKPTTKAKNKSRLNDIVDEVRSAAPEVPLTPYAGTSGWSGSQTSKDRAITQDANGITAASQVTALEFVTRGGEQGATVAEIRSPHTDLHHGKASGALTVLHKAGYLARLTDVRDRCAIYVLPEHVNGRQTVSVKSAVPDPEPLISVLRHFD